MRAAKLTCCLFLLILAMILQGCGSTATTQGAITHAAPPAAHSEHVAIRSTATTSPELATLADPARLIIPAIGVIAPVEFVGILSNGDLATPTESPWEHVGWYETGPRPGEVGSAVIDGHLDRPGGYPAVFWNLRSLHIGDKVIVNDTSGKSWTFRVTRVALYPPQQAPVQEIFGNNAGHYLNLITCAGDWIPSQHQTTLRLVVFTTLVS
jgi:sortase (surface protein transpeptidase)